MASSFVMLLQLVDLARGVLDAVLQDLLSDLFLIEDDNFLDRACAELQILANGQNLADHNRRARQRLQHSPLSALDALRNVHLAFAGEQRDYAHLAQVDACRVLNRFKKAWGLVDFDGLADLYFRLKLFVEGRGSWPGLALKHVNAPHAHGDKQVVQVLRGMNVMGDEVIHLVVGEIPLFLPGINELRDVVKSQAEFLSAPSCTAAGRFAQGPQEFSIAVSRSLYQRTAQSHH